MLAAGTIFLAMLFLAGYATASQRTVLTDLFTNTG
jgi:hypothetical protein